MTLIRSTSPAASNCVYPFEELLGVAMPPPALERGLLHSRELSLAWNLERIAETVGDQCWFSHYYRDNRDPGSNNMKMRLYSFAGFWPSGEFIELRLRGANPLEDQPRGLLIVYAQTIARAASLMTELIENYQHGATTTAPETRVGMLNFANDTLDVERIRITAAQIVPRDRLDFYYRTGMSTWTDAWITTLNTRRYGLTVLTGAPGTGKTTLLRSLAHWLVDSHIIYFMPASRFAGVESGEIVAFWANENQSSKLKKVLILEDAESVLFRRGEDNREKVSTLLNLTDGMLGDALGLHVVCTINGELADLDPALLRPGRLVAHREFALLTADEAATLAKLIGVPPPQGERVSLAEIFNPTGNASFAMPSRPRRAMGFHTAVQDT